MANELIDYLVSVSKELGAAQAKARHFEETSRDLQHKVDRSWHFEQRHLDGRRHLAEFYEAAAAMLRAAEAEISGPTKIINRAERRKRLLESMARVKNAMRNAHDYCDQIPF